MLWDVFGVTVVGRVGTWSGPVVRDVFEAHVVRRVRGEGVGCVRGSFCGTCSRLISSLGEVGLEHILRLCFGE